nr:hypothetical protein [Candidatus Sigynarchaeota archaeon]
MTYDEIKQWIVADAKQQVKDQFTHLWDKLRIEIQTCLAEGFCKIPRDVATPEDIIKQFDACNQIKAISPEIALLQLGRVAEWYLLQALGHASRGDLYDLVRLGETAGLLNKNQAKLFGDIRTMYNALKHDTRFVLDSSILDGLVAKFEMFVKKQRESSL